MCVRVTLCSVWCIVPSCVWGVEVVVCSIVQYCLVQYCAVLRMLLLLLRCIVLYVAPCLLSNTALQNPEEFTAMDTAPTGQEQNLGCYTE